MQTNGETQSKFLVVYMDTKVKGTFRGLNIVSDFAGIGRFVTGYRAWDSPVIDIYLSYKMKELYKT